ncbi:hypothetical protein DFH09DRAFT_1309472 [Mycena vulgaris]|nr:hypothetical protein DFH09DRAFT_1309472 [Mycena vulgaris]
MSLYVEGLLVPSVTFDARPRTVLSGAFSNGLMGSHNKTKLLFTTVVDPYGPLSFLVDCDISASELCPDVSLALLMPGSSFRIPLTRCLDATGLPPSMSIPHKAVATAPPRATDSTAASLPLTGVPRAAPLDDHYKPLNLKTFKKIAYPVSDTVVPHSGPSKAPPPPPRFLTSLSLASYFLSPDPSFNIFLADLDSLRRMLVAHHLPHEAAIPIAHARESLLCHFLSEVCIQTCDMLVTVAANKHECQCRLFCDIYDTPQSMAFDSLSILLSASVERLPQAHINQLAICLGLSLESVSSRDAFRSQIHPLRAVLVRQHSQAHPTQSLFERLEALPKGSLIALACSHGLQSIAAKADVLVMKRMHRT